MEIISPENKERDKILDCYAYAFGDENRKQKIGSLSFESNGEKPQIRFVCSDEDDPKTHNKIWNSIFEGKNFNGMIQQYNDGTLYVISDLNPALYSILIGQRPKSAPGKPVYKPEVTAMAGSDYLYWSLEEVEWEKIQSWIKIYSEEIK